MTRIYTHERAESLRTFRGIINGLIISVMFFWAPLIFLIAWWVNR